MLDAFTAETGIKTEVLFLDKGLEERVAAEGQNSPVDVIMTVDIARLTKAKEAGITQALDDETINAAAAGRIPRSGRPLVRPDQARPRRLRLEGPRDRHRHHLCRPRRPEVEGQALHALGPARLQSGADLGGDRPLGRGEDRSSG